MTDHSDDASATQRLDEAENASFNSARRHVGAAGFVQQEVLEQIISAGKEQISVTRSLRQVIAVTQAQLRDLSAHAATDQLQVHVTALEGIVSSSQEQARTAAELREVIQRALADVRGTPLEDVSATLLNTLSAVVCRQAEQLQALISTALSEASTAGQVAELQQVSAEAQARQAEAEHEQEERELAHLDLLGAEALERVRALEQGGQTDAAQRTALEQQAEHTRLLLLTLEGDGNPQQ
ncbi:hypothetical protein LAJ19_14765 (plasmid) [Deinococcus taeanensis]|uniref:hypothetical protein n=1 Tax=Deinococcus taeanensis TaxID=2737050 RepID=UPI001CDD27B8|nr:hypothetical protein [Deinococcus taeanensis]UBV44425.1 hypothetical protein LAJ19_14765 [Deinococcus taeanensis]